MTDIILTSADDPERFELAVGETCLVKGRLEAVRHGDAAGTRVTKGGRVAPDSVGDRRRPSIVITHADWSMTACAVSDGCTARSIRTPLGTYVTVRCQVINEDAELSAIAIWETGASPVPVIVGQMRETS